MLIIGKTLNHRSIQSTQVYAWLNLDPVRASMGKATSAMFEAGRQQEKAEVIDIKRAA